MTIRSEAVALAREIGLEGLPYVDFKTYDYWRKAGFQVRRGEKSPVFSITWINGKAKRKAADEDEDKPDDRRFPKVTRLFHSSQVDSIEA